MQFYVLDILIFLQSKKPANFHDVGIQPQKIHLTMFEAMTTGNKSNPALIQRKASNDGPGG